LILRALSDERSPELPSYSLSAKDTNTPNVQRVPHKPLLEQASGSASDATEPPEAAVARAVQQKYAEPGQKAAAIINAIAASGEASAELWRAGQTLAKGFSSVRISDWGCFRAGCYVRIAEGQSDTIEREIRSIHAERIPQCTLVTTVDDPPNKLVIVHLFQSK
jgi:hypothetical protein